jgi:D-aspartate ligase
MTPTGATTTNTPPPALILGTGLTVLGSMRSLADAGVRSYCLSEGLGFESRSRWCRRTTSRVEERHDGSRLLEVLQTLQWDRAVLIPCSDHWTVEVAKLPGGSRDRFPSCLPPPGVLERFIDKSRFADLLAEVGVPHPTTEPVSDERRLAELMRASTAGVFLKPTDSQQFLSVFGVKGFTVTRPDDALTRFREIREAGLEVVLQEYIPGGADRHYFVDGFVDDDHRISAWFARRRLRMFPPDFGNSSYVVSVDPRELEEAHASLQALFEAAGYRGIFSAEFMQDRRDDRFKLIEVNCRPWWYVEFASRCGVNVVAMAYASALGRPIPHPGPYRVGAGLINSYYDYLACRKLHRAGELTIASWARSWLASNKSVYRVDDPLPSFAKLERHVRNRLRRLRRTPAR